MTEKEHGSVAMGDIGEEDGMPERIWAGDFDGQGFGHCVAGMQGGLYEEYVRADLARPVQEPVAVPEGWKLVPLAPTKEMCRAYGHHPEWEDDGNPSATQVWRAMLSAAPQPTHGTSATDPTDAMIAAALNVDWGVDIPDADVVREIWKAMHAAAPNGASATDPAPSVLEADFETQQPLSVQEGWQPIETAPELDRVMVCGWSQPTKRVAGYWWWYEDTIINGKACEHPDATYWAPIVIPDFPAAPTVGGTEE